MSCVTCNGAVIERLENELNDLKSTLKYVNNQNSGLIKQRGMDYRGLLKRYMDHVLSCEGATFVYCLDDCTDEEAKVLMEIDNELREGDNVWRSNTE